MIPRRFLLLFLVFPCLLSRGLAARALIASSPRIVISLDGPGWKLAGLAMGRGEKLGIDHGLLGSIKFLPATVPSDVQMLIGLKDVYSQDPEIVEVNKREWWYVRTFPSPKIGSAQQARLIFDGVDYFADVWLNGSKLGSHEGAYTRFSYDVTSALRSGTDNYLAVRVTSPWKVPGRSHYEFMKGEFEENWDALPGPGQVVFPLGLHRSVRLEIASQARVEELQISTTALKEARATLRVRATVSNAGPARRLELRVTLMPENFTGLAPITLLPVRTLTFSGRAGERKEIEFADEISDPRLWWTWDQGPQNLYSAEATLLEKGTAIDKTSSIFGIRTLERDSKLLYKLNGRPIFLRGAWYPFPKMWPADRSRWDYEKDLLLAKNANMNHLVNYTVVETEDFYDLADRLGMLLFVELPFNQEGPIDVVNAQYPRRDEYIRWAADEVALIVRALANHPSVGIWSAVSEVTNNGVDFTTASDPRIAEAADGYALFVKKMGEVVESNDPDALYFRSYCDFGEHHFWEGSLFQGTTYDQQFDAAAQFVSEYGGLAFFPLESIRRVANPDEIWSKDFKPWSNLRLPVNLKKLSYDTGFEYSGLAFLNEDIESNVEREPTSFRDYVNDSELYQAFLYGYAADAYRRKLFSPVTGIRSWMFKSFPEKPLAGFGVIDAFDTPLPAYYAQKRTYAPVTMSFAERYALESVPAGSFLKVPVWISNASNDRVSLDIHSALYGMKGERLHEFNQQISLPAREARKVFDLDWQLPAEPGVYLLRGQADNEKEVVASAEMYVKVVPGATNKKLRILVMGSPEWALPVADFLSNLGAAVSTFKPEGTVIPKPIGEFPASAEELEQKFDVIWLTGLNNYWRDAQEQWTETILKAVADGVTFVHSGSWASFHGGGDDRVAALDLTPLADALPVEVRHENDVIANQLPGHHGPGVLLRPASVVKASDSAPVWLKQVNFAGLEVLNYHALSARPAATTLVEIDRQPLLVTGHYQRGQTFSYLGFTPQGTPKIVDRAVRSSSEDRLFALVAATVLALAAGREPATPIDQIIESRATPLYETLRKLPSAAWPEVTLSWSKVGSPAASVNIKNGPSYIRGFHLWFEGPDFSNGNAIALWSDQYFDLLPGEERDAKASIVTRDGTPPAAFSLQAETLNGAESKTIPVPAL